MERSQSSPSPIERVQTVATVLLHEPVKVAVKEALEEERVRGIQNTSRDSSAQERADSEATIGPSRRSLAVSLLALAGVVYVVRRRRRSGRRDAIRAGRRPGAGQRGWSDREHAQPSEGGTPSTAATSEDS